MVDITGQQLDTYRLIRRLGGGTFGDVYEAIDLHNGKRVAVKVMEPLKTPQATQQFYDEVRALLRVRHVHIVLINDFGIDKAADIPFIVMEYAINGSLRHRHPKGTQVSLTTIVKYIKVLSAALQCMHNDKLIHRDVKPDNVLLDSNGKLLLSDFGIVIPSSSLRIDLNRPELENIAGTAPYMAPEQCLGKPEKASDQYALAIMAYEWVCGRPPFTQGNIYSIYFQHIHEPVPPLSKQFSTIPRNVEAVIMKALSKSPADRFSSVSTFASALENAVQASPTGTKLLTYQIHWREEKAFAWSPNGKFFATGGANGLIQLWDADTGALIRICGNISTEFVCSITWSPDSKRFASGTPGHKIQVWDTSTGQLLLTYDSDVEVNCIIRWSPNSERVASTSIYGGIDVWEANRGHRLHTYWHDELVNALAWSPDGRRIASSSSWDNTVHIWAAKSGQLLLTYTGHIDWINALAWSPDGRWVASGSEDNLVHIWDANTGQLLYIFRGHTDRINTVAWSTDGTRLASGSKDETIQVWEFNNGRLLYVYKGHNGNLGAVAWSPDGMRLASGSYDGTIHIWQIE